MIKNKMIWILILIVVLALVFFVWQNSSFRLKKEVNYKNTKACISNNCFDTEIAENNFQREKGLMFRENLDQDKAMLFVFEKEANYPFWMKNTKINLDIIWIGQDKKIKYISQFTQPCLPAGRLVQLFFCPQINPQTNAKYVLEINGGLCQKFDIKVGDSVDIEL